MQIKTIKLAVFALLTLTLTACANKPTIYYWGKYPSTMQQSLSDQATVSVDEQISLIEKDIQNANHTNKPLPPSMHAHLALLLSEVNKLDLAIKHLLIEKQLFPESSSFVDALITKLKQRSPASQTQTKN